MATRRPKVPRATPSAPKSTDTGAGGDVILADFGGRAAPAGTVSGSRHDESRADSGKGAAAAVPDVQARPSGKSPSGPARDRASQAKDGQARSGGPLSGGAKSGGTKAGSSKKPPTDPEEAPVPAKAFSGRMLALFVVMIAITIMLAPTVKIFFEKRAEIAALQADISAKQSQQNDLKRQVSRWQDPNYVKQQARDRINMVMPGETGYWVFGSDIPAAESGGAAGAASAQDPAQLPWVDSLWESIRRSATD